jgi:Rrf2 family protein
MKITTRGRYGLRAILGLARCYGEGPVLAATLAQREGVSRKYLHALLGSLKAAGLVRSVRGAGGGFELSRAPQEVRLDEVLRAAEGPLCLVDCVARPDRCKRSSDCTARRVWQKLSREIENVLKGVSLQDLLAIEQPDVNFRPARARGGATGRAKKPGRSV